MSVFDDEKETEEPEIKPRDLVGTTIAGRYRVESLLGEGGMGSVYLVQHTGIRKRQALKVLSPRMMRMPSVVARFEREAMAAAHIEHPNVAAASDYGRTDDGRYYLVLEYIEGKELRDVLDAAKGRLAPERALFIVRQIAAALERAHELGIVHRDLKPENIMLVRRDGHEDFVKVLDFGLAQVSRRIDRDENRASTAPKLTQVGEIFGTPAYMAPEQAVGGAIDIRTDLYSLGVIFYELLAGVRPFGGKTTLELIQQHLAAPVPPIKDRAPKSKAPESMEQIARRLLEKQPEDRFKNPQELLTAIDKAAAAESISLPGVSGGSKSDSAKLVPIEKPRLPFVKQLTVMGAQLSQVVDKAREKVFPKHAATGKLQIVLQRVSGLLKQKSTRLPKSLQRFPLWMFLAAAALVVALPLGIYLYTPGGDTSTKPTSTPPKPKPVPPELLASQTALDAAVVQGTVALETLSSRFPKDARVLRALAKSQAAQHQYVEAIHVMSKLAVLDPGVGRDAEMVRIIVAALQGAPEGSQAAVTLMEQDLGDAGVDLLYDVTVKQTQARWKPRVFQSLTKPEVLAKASPATKIALALRNAKTCEAKHQLLPQVAREGADRALTLLRSLTSNQGCGFFGTGDCWPCLRKDTALKDSIAAVEARTKTASP